ncbi:hypothetical protein VTK26DRAFT_1679 [Humicola hyalothermophila]
MCQPPPTQAVRDMIGPAIPEDVTVKTIQLVQSIRPQRIFALNLSDGRTLHLVQPPPSMWRPMRHEQDIVEAEAAAIQWIRGTVSSQHPSSSSSSSSSFSSSASTSSSISNPPASPLSSPPDRILSLLPTLLHHGREPTTTATMATAAATAAALLLSQPFAVYAPVRGAPLSLLPTPPAPLPRPAREQIDRETGRLFRALARLTSPTGRFGPLAAVLGRGAVTRARAGGPSSSISSPLSAVAAGGSGSSSSSSSSSSSTADGGGGGSSGKGEKKDERGKRGGSGRRGTGRGPRDLNPHLGIGVGMGIGPGAGAGGGLSMTGGAGTWSVAFHSMLEAALRDGEDMAVAMGYATIRKHFRRLAYVLDGVETARLVVVKGGEKGNVLVQEEVGEMEEEDDGGQVVGGKADEGEEGERVAIKEGEGDGEGEGKVVENGQKRFKVTGFLDWSSCMFGDPLLATVFSDPQQEQAPSAAFLEGFNGAEIKPDSDSRSQGDLPLNGDIIDDVDGAWIRLLLYQVYHAVVDIVSEFYRPRQNSSARELEARRKLSRVLTKLAEVPDDAKRRHQRPSGEMSPAKRIKADDDG